MIPDEVSTGMKVVAFQYPDWGVGTVTASGERIIRVKFEHGLEELPAADVIRPVIVGSAKKKRYRDERRCAQCEIKIRGGWHYPESNLGEVDVCNFCSLNVEGWSLENFKGFSMITGQGRPRR